MGIQLVVGGEVAGNRTRAIDYVEGSYVRRVRGGKVGLGKE